MTISLADPFGAGHTVETTDKFAPEVEAMLCSRLEAQTAPAPPTPPAPARRRGR